jgi:preprotein translocase subunit SecA
MNADQLREALDASGRFLIHRIHWFQSVEEIGGLHVIGTERHESRRIDNQLRARSGRQGDRGSSRFFVSLEDDLMKMFAGETQMKILARLGMKEGDSIEHPWLSKSVERAQRKVEERNFQIRKNILEYDEVMEHQRQRFYGLRQQVLEGRQTKAVILEYIEKAIQDAAGEYLDKDYPVVCVAEYTRQKLECSIAPESLRGLEPHEMEKKIKAEAKAESRHMIDVTIGEYIPDEGSEIAMDFDVQGLIAWARTRFGVELTPRPKDGPLTLT